MRRFYIYYYNLHENNYPLQGTTDYIIHYYFNFCNAFRHFSIKFSFCPSVFHGNGNIDRDGISALLQMLKK